MDEIVADVRFPQISQINEGHSAHAVAEYEEIARQHQRSGAGEIQSGQMYDHRFVDGPFARPVDSCIYVTKRVVLYGKIEAYCFIVNRTKDAHVERDRIAQKPASEQIGVVPVDQRFGQVVRIEDRIADVGRKTVPRTPVVARRAELAGRAEPVDPCLEERLQGLPPGVGTEPFDDILHGVTGRPGLQHVDDAA